MKIANKIKVCLVMLIFLICCSKNYAITQEEAGQIIAQFAINFYDNYASETIYSLTNWEDNTNSHRAYAYRGQKVSGSALPSSGMRQKGMQSISFTDKYGMDCVGFVSFCIHQSLRLGSETTFTCFVTPQSGGRNGFTQVKDGSRKPGDILATNGHVAVYIGNGEVIDSAAAGPNRSISRRAKANVYPKTYRITQQAAANISKQNTTVQFEGKGSTDYSFSDSGGSGGTYNAQITSAAPPTHWTEKCKDYSGYFSWTNVSYTSGYNDASNPDSDGVQYNGNSLYEWDAGGLQQMDYDSIEGEEVEITLSFYCGVSNSMEGGPKSASGRYLVYGNLANNYYTGVKSINGGKSWEKLNNGYSLGTNVYIKDVGLFSIEDRGGSADFNTTYRMDLFVPRKEGESDKEWEKRTNSYGHVKVKAKIMKESTQRIWEWPSGNSGGYSNSSNNSSQESLTVPSNIESSQWIYPLASRHTLDPLGGSRYFGANRSNGTRAHAGIDLIVSPGVKVVAMTDGTVIQSYNFYQNTDAVEVQNDDGTIARYTEMSVSVKAGQKVKKGDVLGKIIANNSGSSMLHIEVYDGSGTGALTQRGNKTYKNVKYKNYQRRSDLMDPTFIKDLPMATAQ